MRRVEVTISANDVGTVLMCLGAGVIGVVIVGLFGFGVYDWAVMHPVAEAVGADSAWPKLATFLSIFGALSVFAALLVWFCSLVEQYNPSFTIRIPWFSGKERIPRAETRRRE